MTTAGFLGGQLKCDDPSIELDGVQISYANWYTTRESERVFGDSWTTDLSMAREP